ncbi:hypothetical protein, partial [Siccirubricoccus phaeus]|uniref:hypothetical protein n=1 Tax=Siccirubricoccus phaeus TaxID=2595053 RepID=UPI0011F31693
MPVQPASIVNLLLSFVSNPISGPDTVRKLRSLQPRQSAVKKRNEGGKRFVDFGEIIAAEYHYETLGELLDNLVSIFAILSAEDRGRILSLAKAERWSFVLSLTPLMAMQMRMDDAGTTHTTVFEPPTQDSLFAELSDDKQDVDDTRVQYSTQIPLALLIVISDAAAEAVRRGSELPLPPGQNSAGRENAGPRTKAGAPIQQGRTTPTDISKSDP